MEKVLSFLEKYVEWIAIAIGGLIFMYAVWIFWIAPDITAEVNGEEVGPRTVDAKVLAGPGASLDAAMNKPQVPIPSPPDLAEEFAKSFEMRSYEARLLHLPGLYAGPNPMGLADDTIIPGGGFFVDRAPVPPPAHVTRLASGRSFADVAAPQGQPEARDLAEVRVDFTVPAFTIAQAFREVRLPAVNQTTSVLRVILQRQRLRGDGSWAEDHAVALLENNPLATMPVPQESATVDEKNNYVAFVEQNPTWVLQPPFYEVRAGDNPMALGAVVNVPAPGQDAVPAGDAQTKPAPGDNTGDNTGQTNYGRQGDPRAPAGQAEQPATPIPQPPPQQRRPGQPQPPPGPILPPGAFNAAQLQGAINGWAWDTEAVPGETYRYRVVYALKNPMFNTRSVAARPELEALLALLSDEAATEWSPPINVEPLSYWFMKGSTSTSAKFDVFRWQNGAWQMDEAEVSPGDVLGVERPTGIDFRTGRTLVDVREDAYTKEIYALLVDDQGRFSRRSAARDKEDPKYKQLQDAIKAGGEGVAGR